MLNKGSLTWDEYFFLICQSTALKSTCLSRKIGAILVKDKSIISTGYNGPPRGIPHCGHVMAHLMVSLTVDMIDIKKMKYYLIQYLRIKTIVHYME